MDNTDQVVARHKRSFAAIQTKQVVHDVNLMLSTNLGLSRMCKLESFPSLTLTACPRFRMSILDDGGNRIQAGACIVRVINEDTLNAAVRPSDPALSDGRKCVLNHADESVPGGAWESGLLSQESSILYRTSLHLSLANGTYPIPALGCIYSPNVIVIREPLEDGHSLLPEIVAPESLQIVSVISMAAIRTPMRTMEYEFIDGKVIACEVYSDISDREMTKAKMRLCLRVAAKHGHTRLVLGAFGCGLFENPPEDVARCWKEVLHESEFVNRAKRSWFRCIDFAVLGIAGQGLSNFNIFHEILDNTFEVLEDEMDAEAAEQGQDEEQEDEMVSEATVEEEFEFEIRNSHWHF